MKYNFQKKINSDLKFEKTSFKYILRLFNS